MARLRVAVTTDMDLAILYRADQADPLLLLIGMVLDQQQSIERAFTAPFDLLKRMGRPADGSLHASEIATMDPTELARLFAIVPALHRFPGSMAKRTQDLCRHVVEVYDDRPADLWRTAATGEELCARMKKVPGFGEHKAKVFTALVAKRLGLRLSGWEVAAGAFAEEGSLLSVADLDSPDALRRYREARAARKAPVVPVAATPSPGKRGRKAVSGTSA